MTAFGQKFQEHVFGPLDFVWIILRLDHQPDLAIFITIQYVGNGDGFVAFVLDGANHRAFHDHEANDPTFLARLPLDVDVVKTSGVPKRQEIPVQGLFIVLVAFFGVNEGLESILANAPRATEFDRLDDVFGRLAGLSSSGHGRGWRRHILNGRLLPRRCRDGLERILLLGGGRLLLLLLRRLLRLGRGLQVTDGGKPESKKGRGNQNSSQAATPVKRHLCKDSFQLCAFFSETSSRPVRFQRGPWGRSCLGSHFS